jgi:hypothetical protein
MMRRTSGSSLTSGYQSVCIGIRSEIELWLYRQFLSTSDRTHFLASLATMDETWIHLYDPETKKQGVKTQWLTFTKTALNPKSAFRVMASIFWDKDGTLLVEYLEKSATITVRCYTSPLDKVKQAFVSKWWQKM